MAKLTFKKPFTLEVEGDTYTGTFKDMTRKENNAFKHKFMGTDVDSDEVFKERLLLSLEGEDVGHIMAIGDKYNYQIVFETIIKDINETSAKN